MGKEFSQVIPWYVLRKHLEQQLRAVDSKLRRATEPEASVLRGRAQLLEELQNLPETLAMVVDEEKEK